MASANILRSQFDGLQKRSCQLLKNPTGAQLGGAVVTAAQLSQSLQDVAFAGAVDVDFLDVERFRVIRVQLWGVADNDHTVTAHLYGWPAGGPGSHMASLAAAHGNFTSAANTGFHASTKTHQSIRDAFDPTAALRGCDTVAPSSEYETEYNFSGGDATAGDARETRIRPVNTPSLSDGTATVHADFPNYLTIDFSYSAYKYFGVVVTALQGTSCGAIWLPVQIW